VRGSRPTALLIGALLCAADMVAGPPAVASVTAATAPSSSASYAADVDGGLDQVVVDRSGYAFATNPSRDQVEVLSLATGELKAPITVGSTPAGLDLNADETMLYVANVYSNDISVVDLSLRREVRRIALPPAPNGGVPFSIAVAANGTALLTRTSWGPTSEGSPTLSIDLSSGAARERREWDYSPAMGERSVVRASRDRSRIAIVRQHGPRELGFGAFYDASTGMFTAAKLLPNASMVAVDATGATMLVGPDTSVIDRGLVLRGTVPGAGARALAIRSSGSTAYRLRDANIEVIDVARALVAGTIALPDPTPADLGGRLALTPDDATLVALTGRGFSVAAVDRVSPVACPTPAGPAAVVRPCGAPLADVEIDGRGRAYASNPARNQIEVVALASRTLEAPIPVGSQPTSIDLSPDGNTLYVADSGAEEISVVDLVLRREVRRITVTSSADRADRPESIAVAANGTALLTTRPLAPEWRSGRLLRIDLLTGASRQRDDYPDADSTAGWRAQSLAASADGGRIAATPGTPGGGDVFVYVAATDSFTQSKELAADVTYAALDGAGSKTLVGHQTMEGWEGATYVLDGDLVRRATIPSGGTAETVNGSGTVSYRLATVNVEVLDLDRGFVRGRIGLPESVEGVGAIAVSPDETVVAALTRSGISVVSVATAAGVGCAAVPARPAVTAICGAPLGEVVIDGTGRAYASNTERNEIAVVSLTTGQAEPPILVGSRPRGLDLSADGKTLYVANSGAEEISVVDLARRVEVRRITVPSRTGGNERPFSIAVGNRDIALFSTTAGGSGFGGSVYQLDLRSETVRLRDDMGGSGGRTTVRTAVVASGDRSRIVVAATQTSGGDVFIYSTETDTFSPQVRLDRYLAFVGADGAGSRFVFDPGGLITDGEGRPEGEISAGGYGVAVNRAGTIAYRVQFSAVEVIDLDRRTVMRSIPLPEPVSVQRGGIALSPDETTLAVITHSGISRLQVQNGPPQAPYSSWTQPASTPLDGLGTWMAVGNTPTASPGQSPPAYLYAHHFSFANSPAIGAIALVTSPGGRAAMFTVAAPDGTPHTVVIPFNWSSGHFYYSLVHRLGPGSWGGWMYDYSSGVWTFVGRLNLPGEWGKLSPATMTMALWIGSTAPTCSEYPRADVYFSPPVGYAGTSVSTAPVGTTKQTPGACAASTSVEAGTWIRYLLGADTAVP